MTHEQLKELGFELETKFPHDHFESSIYIKGVIKVFLTKNLNNQIITTDIEVEETTGFSLSITNLAELDKILNNQGQI